MKSGKGRNHYQPALLEEGVSDVIPSTRYQGSKAKLINWIWDNTKTLRFDSVLDAFGGTGVVGYMFKRKGKLVHYNDYLRSNYLIGLAIIENNKVRLSEGDVQRLLYPTPTVPYKEFISETFREIYYADDENQWVDIVVQNIGQLEDSYKRALAYYALFQACLVKRPFNLFHRKNLYLRFADVSRSFGNKTTWDRPFVEHFYDFVFEVNALVFDNGRENRASNLDVFAVEGDFDLVYIDPPYTNQAGATVDYLQFYHFLEGLSHYEHWHSYVDHRSKNRSFRRVYNAWNDPRHIRRAFQSLFERFKDSILVVSYREDGIPPVGEIVGYLEAIGKRVAVETFGYKYVLSNHRSAETLIIGT